ncbi:polyphosphate kinase 2 family protein [Gordonia liuliyuniae]|uniref:Polyphosphate kinase 2 family protein n=1 Tax=Gordonia liuliyuniae TaxID=2911517 RepID=A0ABS9ISN7_9ACTN|nr:polyphosphate kinase 2 family protein [Gordonia liuliyuniae]MCF8588575.1 polyphosphate kinase 2 family protein [Gordonia liuliyuniae]
MLRARSVGGFAQVDPASTPGYDGDKKTGAAELAAVGEKLSTLQEMLFAEARSGGDRSVLLVLQGMDTAGKGGIVRHVGGLVDPQGLAVTGFGRPTRTEAAHDFLWRIRKALPAPGHIGVFDRSHYEDVLPVRVHSLVPESVWRPRFDDINAFEAELAASGTSIIKCALVVSKDEQKARLAERLKRPDKFWKYDPSDLTERAYWDEYLQAYQEIFDRTDTDAAPWHVIPADRKWFSRLAVAQILLETLESLDLSWPPANFDVDAEKARLAALDD